jgi:hypothetical protein
VTTVADIVLRFAAPLLIFTAVAVVMLLRRRKGVAQPESLERLEDGVTLVPVRGIFLRQRGLLAGTTDNSINPRFAITRDGFRYRVFREALLLFNDIEHVEVRKRFGRIYLLFLNSAGPRLLSVNIGDRDTAKLVLDAMPPSVALTQEAATVRDGTPTAGAARLSLYHGRFA